MLTNVGCPYAAVYELTFSKDKTAVNRKIAEYEAAHKQEIQINEAKRVTFSTNRGRCKPLLYRSTVLGALTEFLCVPVRQQRDRLAREQYEIEQRSRALEEMKSEWVETDEQSERLKREQRLKDAKIRLGVSEAC
mgnify:CR=1 FL=1